MERDVEWIRSRISRYRLIMILLLTVPGLLFIILLFIPDSIGLAVTFAMMICFIAGFFLLFFYRNVTQGVIDNLDTLDMFPRYYGDEVRIRSYDPFRNFTSYGPATITFKGSGKLPRLFRIQMNPRSLYPLSLITAMSRLVRYNHPYYRISIPWGTSPWIGLFGERTVSDEEEIKEKLDKIVSRPLPAIYIVSIQHMAGGFTNKGVENRLVADIFDKKLSLDKTREILTLLYSIRKIVYGKERINSIPVSMFGQYYRLVGIYSCPRCEKIISIIKMASMRSPVWC
ncbi:MAG: hypothetical protein ACMUIG_06440 [Thermoplasmatota archaeon]